MARGSFRPGQSDVNVAVVLESAAPAFLKLAAPRREDLSHMLERIVVKTPAMVRRRGLLEERSCDSLASVQAEAVQKTPPWAQPGEEAPKKLEVFLDGFSLQAGA